MPKFKDADGREWIVEPTLPDLRLVRSELDVNLLDFGNKHLFARLVDDQELLIDILSVILTPQIQAREMSADDFARGLRGDVLDDAIEKFLESLVGFFPRRRRRFLEAALAKTATWMDRQTDHVLTILEGPKMDQILQQGMDEIDREIDRLATSGRPSRNGSPSQDLDPTPVSASASSPGDSMRS